MLKEVGTAMGNELQMEVTVTMDKKTGQGQVRYSGENTYR